MTDDEFRQKLSEVADWEIPKLPPSVITESKRRSRGRKSKEQQYQEEHEEVFLDLFEGVNPTYAPVLLKLKPKACVCEDCGQHCENGRHKEKKLYETGGHRNWRERCLTCERSQNPFTGKYDLTFSEASHVWAEFLRERKGLYKTAANQAREAAGVIRIYPDTTKSDK